MEQTIVPETAMNPPATRSKLEVKRRATLAVTRLGLGDLWLEPKRPPLLNVSIPLLEVDTLLVAVVAAAVVVVLPVEPLPLLPTEAIVDP